MTSTSGKKGTLSVTGPFETTQLRVLDAGLREVASGTHAITKELEPGIYRVVAQVPGSRDEKLVLIESGKAAEVGEFNLFWDSVTPHEMSASKHEYQTYPAEAMSKQTHVNAGGNARLFVYVRTAGAPGGSVTPFRLRSADRTIIAAFPDVGEVDQGRGWMALSVQLHAGTYHLEQDIPGLGCRAQSVFVEDGWQTQMFVPWRDTARFAQAVVHIHPADQGFQHLLSYEYTQTEAALAGLANQKVVLHPGEIDLFLKGKFHDPMLGLIGAYSLLLAGSVDYDDVSLIAANLTRLLPHSPDAKLIALLAKLRGAPIRVDEADVAPHQDDKWPTFTEPPVFTIGTRHFLELSSRRAELCPADSHLGRISLALVTDGVWTRWDSDRETSDTIDVLTGELSQLFQEGQSRLKHVIDDVARLVSSGTLPLVSSDDASSFLRLLAGSSGSRVVRALEENHALGSSIAQYAVRLAARFAPQYKLPRSVVAEALEKLLRDSLRQVGQSTVAPSPQAKAKRKTAGPDSVKRQLPSSTGTGRKRGVRKGKKGRK